jgi:hypothetical protein
MTIPFGLTVSLSQMTNRRFRGSFADENGKGIPQEVRRSRIWTNFSVSEDNSPPFRFASTKVSLSQMTIW